MNMKKLTEARSQWSNGQAHGNETVMVR